MKMSIEQHRQCLANKGDNYDREKIILRAQERKVNRLGWDLEHLREQINSALDQGKDGFDAERFIKMENPYS